MNKTFKQVATIALLAFSLLLIASPVFVSADLVTPTMINGAANSTNASGILATVTNWVLGIVGAVAILFIIYGGFRYITAQGNSQQMDTAKNILIKAIIGLVIVVVAYVIVQVVIAALVTKT